MPHSSVSLDDLLYEYMDQEKIYRYEGRKGIENLAKIVRALGYKDPQFYGLIGNGAALGDIFEFLEDNPGAIEAIVKWVGEMNTPEWREAIESQLPEKEEEDEEEEE